MTTEQIIIKHQGNTTVFVIPPTVAEHNVMMALLQRIRHDYPGVWYCALEWDRSRNPTVIGKTQEVVGKMKEVSREAFGLPKDEPLGDVPT